MNRWKRSLIAALLVSTLHSGSALAERYEIDPDHSFILWKIPHLSFGIIAGRFNRFDGHFTWDADKPGDASIRVTIQTDSVDTNHAERDKHLRQEDILNVDEYPTAVFEGTSYSGGPDGGTMTGQLTLNGRTRPITLEVERIGEGEPPMPNIDYIAGFKATTRINRSEFGYVDKLPPGVKIADVVEFEIYLEGHADSP